MKRILLSILILFALCPVVHSAGLGFVSALSAGGAGCSPGLGAQSVLGTAYALAADVSVCHLVTAQCGGTLNKAYLYTSDASGTANASVAVYTDPDLDGNGDVSDLKVAVSASMAESGGSGWKEGVFSSGTITSGVAYLVCVFNSTDSAWNLTRGAVEGNTLSYKATSGYYDANPDTLSGMNGYVTPNAGPLSVMVTIK